MWPMISDTIGVECPCSSLILLQLSKLTIICMSLVTHVNLHNLYAFHWHQNMGEVTLGLWGLHGWVGMVWILLFGLVSLNLDHIYSDSMLEWLSWREKEIRWNLMIINVSSACLSVGDSPLPMISSLIGQIHYWVEWYFCFFWGGWTCWEQVISQRLGLVNACCPVETWTRWWWFFLFHLIPLSLST